MTMNNETPPLDLAHLNQLWKRSGISAILWRDRKDDIIYMGPIENNEALCQVFDNIGEDESEAAADLIPELLNAFPQLCRELEAARESAKEDRRRCSEWSEFNDRLRAEVDDWKEKYNTLLSSDSSLQSQLSKAEESLGIFLSSRKTVSRGVVGQTMGHESYRLEFTGAQMEVLLDKFRDSQPLPQTEGREVGDSGIRIMPAQSRRVESGALQFGGDWPGVFFRGDDAGHSAMVLGQFIEIVRQSDAMHPIMLMQVESVKQRLASCVIGPAKELLSPAPVSEKGPVDSPEGLRPHIEK
jgi:hypothetical protein